MNLKALLARLKALREDVAPIVAKAQNGDALTDDERAKLTKATADAKAISEQIEQVKADEALVGAAAGIGGGVLDAKGDDPGAAAAGASGGVAVKTIGQVFTESPQFKTMLERGLSGDFASGMVDTLSIDQAKSIGMKTLLTEAGGGASLLQPDVQTGILPLLFRPLTIADLLPTGTAASTSIRYLVESTFTNAAATVAEGGTKPESALAFTSVDETFRKIAHVLPVTDEMLEDIAALRSYIDARLILGVQLTEEDQLLNGSGAGSNLTGFLNRAGLATAVARGTDTNADAIFKQIIALRVNALVQPDAVIINPANWQTIALDKDGNGAYRAGGPFESAGIFGLGGGPNLWGLRVVVTPAIAAGTALVGAFRTAAQLYRKGGIQVEASNSHSTFFIENKTMIRAEERLALAVYRPAAFGTVTGLV